MLPCATVTPSCPHPNHRTPSSGALSPFSKEVTQFRSIIKRGSRRVFGFDIASLFMICSYLDDIRMIARRARLPYIGPL